jgi:hypothetical protein
MSHRERQRIPFLVAPNGAVAFTHDLTSRPGFATAIDAITDERSIEKIVRAHYKCYSNVCLEDKILCQELF